MQKHAYKFGSQYGAHAGGRRNYIDYDRMKEYLHVHEDEEKSALPIDPSAILHNSAFLKIYFDEVERTNEAYVLRLNSIYGLFDNFELLADAYVADGPRDKRLRKVAEATLKRSANHLYNKIVKLEGFRLLNRTAAIKILKKYDKIAVRRVATSCFDVCMDKVDAMKIGHGKELVQVKDHLTLRYAELFCDGELEEANLKLALSKNDINVEVLKSVALKVGIILALVLIIIRNQFLHPHISILFLLGSDPCVYVYTAVAALITYRWFWGFAVYMWDKAGVDYILVLSLDPNKHMPTYADIYNDASTLSVLFLVNFQLFHLLRYYHTRQTGEGLASSLIYVSEYAYVLPVALVAGTLARAIGSYAQPTSYGVYSTYIASRLARTPFLKVYLRDNFAANILSSFTKVWSAILYSGCYFGTGAFLHAVDPASAEGIALFNQCGNSHQAVMARFALKLLPSCIRFLQCLRQRRDFLILSATPPTTASAVVAVSPAVDYSLEPRLEDALEQSMEEVFSSSGANTESTVLSGSRPHSPTRDRGNATVMHSNSIEALENDECAAAIGLELSDISITNTSSGRLESSRDASPIGIEDTIPPFSNSFFDICALCLTAYARRGARALRSAWAVMWVWPHSFNALRYFLTLMVAYFGSMPPQDPFSMEFMCWYIPLHVISTLYNCYWDVIVDYQLFHDDAEDPFLRKKLFYYKMKGFYYFVIVINPVFRFLWTLSYTPYGSHPFLVVFEIARRGFWAVLRMEVVYIKELERRRAA